MKGKGKKVKGVMGKCGRCGEREKGKGGEVWGKGEGKGWKGA